jgi:PAS domain S-box-containing protein
MLRQPGETSLWGPWLGHRRWRSCWRIWAPAVGLCAGLGVLYVVAALIGLALLGAADGVAPLSPAAGVAAGALIVLEGRARVGVAAVILATSVAMGLNIGRDLPTAVALGMCSAGEGLLTAWLVRRWSGCPFRFDTWRGLWGFLAAAGVASALAAAGGALATWQPAWQPEALSSLVNLWRVRAAAHGLAIVTIAPLLVGLHHLACEGTLPPRRLILEGSTALVLLGVTSYAIYASSPGSWLSHVPAAALFAYLLWIAARCPPVFAAAAAFTGSAVLLLAATSHIGRFAGVPLDVPSIQVVGLIGSLCTLTLSALFSERGRAEAALRESNERLRLALSGAELGVWSVDLVSRAFESDERDARINCHDLAAPPRSLSEARRFINPDDLPRLDAAFVAARRTGAPCRAEYRLRTYANPGPKHTRWVAVEGNVERNAAGRPIRMLGITRDITERKIAEQALAERTAQLALAGRAGLVGSYSFDPYTGIIQISAGLAAIYGLPEDTTEMTRADWRAHVHPDDISGYEAHRARTIAAREREMLWEYRIRRPDGGVRWIEQRSLIAYDDAGAPRRLVGVNIDVTDRKRDEEHKSLLVAELDHRVKNVLAVVSALVSRAREASSGSVPELVAALDGRIKSMATTHELLSGRRWQGLSLGELIDRELEPYATGSNVTAEGPDVVLQAEAGQALAMVVHELITNAAKYGALSVQQGRVAVRWRLVPENGTGAHLALDWQESGGPVVEPSARIGYGTSVIRDLVPYELGGAAELGFPPEGVRCRMQIPVRWLAALACVGPGGPQRSGPELAVVTPGPTPPSEFHNLQPGEAGASICPDDGGAPTGPYVVTAKFGTPKPRGQPG